MNKKKVIFTLGIGFYIASLFLPVWECKNGTEFSGLHVLMIGYMGLLYADPRWFCNIVAITAVLSLANNKPVLKTISVCFALLSVSTLFGPYMCGVTGGPLGYGVSPSFGNVSWVLSICLLALYIYLIPKVTINNA